MLNLKFCLGCLNLRSQEIGKVNRLVHPLGLAGRFTWRFSVCRPKGSPKSSQTIGFPVWEMLCHGAVRAIDIRNLWDLKCVWCSYGSECFIHWNLNDLQTDKHRSQKSEAPAFKKPSLSSIVKHFHCLSDPQSVCLRSPVFFCCFMENYTEGQLDAFGDKSWVRSQGTLKACCSHEWGDGSVGKSTLLCSHEYLSSNLQHTSNKLGTTTCAFNPGIRKQRHANPLCSLAGQRVTFWPLREPLSKQ